MNALYDELRERATLVGLRRWGFFNRYAVDSVAGRGDRSIE